MWAGHLGRDAGAHEGAAADVADEPTECELASDASLLPACQSDFHAAEQLLPETKASGDRHHWVVTVRLGRTARRIRSEHGD